MTVSSVQASSATISNARIMLMAAACGFAVSTIYYNQPLLPQMGASFGRSSGNAGLIATVTQLGYAAGLFLFVPLGDKIDRRRLILLLLTSNMLCLVGAAIAPNFAVLLLASLLIGITGVTAQVIIPAVSGLAQPAQRGRVVGTLLSGLSAGLLLARTLSGLVGAHAGWRSMFVLAGFIDLVLMAIVWSGLPETEGSSELSYTGLLASLGAMLRDWPSLRVACLTGFLMFGAFSALWGSLATLVARPPYNFGSDAAGAFGFLGIIGLLSSPMIGKAADRFGPRPLLMAGPLALTTAFLLVAGAAHHLIFLIAGIVLTDLGNRIGLVANQTRIYALSTDARSRLNTLLMTTYFLGGATGAGVAAAVTSHFGWFGLSLTGAVFGILALIAHLLSVRPGGHAACPR
jgi:predicted MFS family arabinose efflux permease